MAPAGRDEQMLLTLEVARRHYLDGWSKLAVAQCYGLSRFQVARMITRARDQGWVRIEIDSPAHVDMELGDRVRALLGLRHVLVVRPARRGATTRSEIAAATAQLLQNVLSPDDTLGLAWSRTVAAAVDRVEHVPRIPVVQLTGALPRAEEVGSSVELVRRFAAISGGAAYLYYAPMILEEETAAASLRAQAEVDRAIARIPDVSVAVVAVGAWVPGSSTVHDAMSPTDREAVSDLGVVAEISGVFVGEGGALPEPEVSRRMLRPSAAELGAVGHVIAVVPEEHCATSVGAAVSSGLLDSIVICQTTAEDLLLTAST